MSGSGPPCKMKALDLQQINQFIDPELAPPEGMNFGEIQMDPSATFYPSKSSDEAEFANESNMSDIKSQNFQNSSQRFNRLDSASFTSSMAPTVNLHNEEDKATIIRYIDELKYSELRDNALLELSRQREHFQELAPFVWHSVGTIPALLLEIVSVYPLLSPPLLDSKTSNKACNVLAMLQCVASHKDTRQLFLKANIHFYTFPFLNTVSKGRSFEYLRLTSLGVIGALVKVDDPKVIDFLIKTEIIPLCLRIMERGTELSQTVATFIIQKILMDEEGLKYLCMKPERYLAVSNVLNYMVESQLQKPSQRLLKHIIKCYYRLSENSRAQVALVKKVPSIVKHSNKINDSLDDSSKKLLQSLIETLRKVEDKHHSSGQSLEDSMSYSAQPAQASSQNQGLQKPKSAQPQTNAQQNPQFFRNTSANLNQSATPFTSSANFVPTGQSMQKGQPMLSGTPIGKNMGFMKGSQGSPQSQSPTGPPQFYKKSSMPLPFNPQQAQPNFMMQPPQSQNYNYQSQMNYSANNSGRQSPPGQYSQQYGYYQQ